MQAARPGWLDPHDFHAPGPPGGDPRDEPAASDSHEHRVERASWEALLILVPLEGHGACAGDGARPLVGVHAERARLGDVAIAGRLGVGVPRTADDDLGAMLFDGGDFHGGGDLRDEDPRAVPELLGRVGDGDAVVPARGRGDAGERDARTDQVHESAARFEGAGVLEELELEGDVAGAEVAGIGGEERRAANVRGDAGVGVANLTREDGEDGEGHGSSSPRGGGPAPRVCPLIGRRGVV